MLDRAALARPLAGRRDRRHVWPSLLTGADREPFARQAALDWRAFLDGRAEELRPGGALVVVVPAAEGDGGSSLAELGRRMTAALEGMVHDGSLGPAELARMVIPTYNRSLAELEAPFADPGCGLALEEIAEDRTPDPFWQAFERPAILRPSPRVRRLRARGVRPDLPAALDPTRTPDERGRSLAEALAADVSGRRPGAHGDDDASEAVGGR